MFATLLQDISMRILSMKDHKIIRLFILALMFGACSSKNSDDPILKEAFQYHQMAVAIHDTVITKLHSLEDVVKASSKQDSVGLVIGKQLEIIQQDFKRWDESLVGVPGFEPDHDHSHDHDHDHDHSHDHSKDYLKEMSSEQILELQKGLKTEIMRIHDMLDSLLLMVP